MAQRFVRALGGSVGFTTEQLRRPGTPALELRGLNNRSWPLVLGGPESAVGPSRTATVVEAYAKLALDFEAYARDLPRIVDEIGPRQCACTGFVDAMRGVLASDSDVVCTSALGGHPFVDEVQRMTGLERWVMTEADRDDIVVRVLDRLGRTLPEGIGGRTFLRAALARGATSLHLALDEERGEGVSLFIRADREPVVSIHNFFDVSRSDAGYDYSLREALAHQRDAMNELGAGWFAPFLDALVAGRDFSWPDVEAAHGRALVYNFING